MLVTALIPVYNEEKKIEQTINSLKRIDLIDNIIVIDDGSTDNTVSKIQSSEVKIIKLKNNQGKGQALNQGALNISGDIILLVDGDLGETAIEAEKLIRPILAGEADVTIAKFPYLQGQKGGFGIVKGLAFWSVYLASGFKCHSVLSGQRAMVYKAFKEQLPFTSGYSAEVASTIKLVNLGYRILEVPVQMSHNFTRRNLAGFYHRGKQFWHIFLFLARRWLCKC
ncbi:glycosyltransferase family 2 protein [Bacillota bacterium LX-D]|nr:glycosyltransferase family 2 protein [Bacillota bacterium LX-D]